LAVIGAMAVAFACARAPLEPRLGVAALVAAHPSEPAADSEDAPRVHGQRKQLNIDVPVFVDGEQRGVLRYGELPPGCEPTTSRTNAHHALRYYRVSDYLAGIGVDVSRVKAIHFADKSDRIASLEGDELRADKDRFVFDFTATTAGMPQMAWDTVGLKTTLRIDYFYGLNVFVSRTPAEIDHRRHCYVDDGECTPVARFGAEGPMKGTRVYVDGKLVSYVKRRLLSDSAIAAKASDDEAVFSTTKYLASIGVDAAQAKRVELLAGDAIVGSASGTQWAVDDAKLTFRLVRHAHGRVRANVPADLQAEAGAERVDRESEITAIEVFRRKEARALPIVPIARAIEPGAPAESTGLQAASGDEAED
jgi:hypothetical protein